MPSRAAYGGEAPCTGGNHAGECSAMMCLHGNLPKMAAPMPEPEAVLNTGPSDAKHPQSPRDQVPDQVIKTNWRNAALNRFYLRRQSIAGRRAHGRHAQDASLFSSHTNSGRPRGSDTSWILCPRSAERKESTGRHGVVLNCRLVHQLVFLTLSVSNWEVFPAELCRERNLGSGLLTLWMETYF